MAKINLTTIENMTVEYCNQIHKYTDGLDLSYVDIRATSKMLVELYKAKQSLKLLREINKTHEVIDHHTGKVIGELYDNPKIEGVMMSANIQVNSWIQACEWEIGRQTRSIVAYL